MNKRAKEKQLLEEAYIQVLEEDWKKGTSKAPKGASFDSENNYKPSGRDAHSDGPGGRYRRTRPPGSGSTKTHGEAGIKAEDNEVYDRIDGLINIKDKERLVHLFKLAIADPGMLDVVTSIHDDLKEEGFDVDDINDYIVETFKFTLGG